jgi:lysophospholipase
LKKFIDTVVKPETHPKVFALGHSLGGLILTRYMEQYPNQLKKVVLSSPMYKYSGTVTDMASQKAAATFVKTGKGLDYIMGQEGSYNPTIPFIEQGKINSLTTSRNRFDLRKFIVQEHPATALGGKTWGWMNETLKNTDLVKKYATKIRDSVLILQAADDQLIDLSGHQEVCTMINQNVEPTQTPLCKIIRFPNAQHELLMEKDEVRNRVLDEIVTYFSK